MFTRGGGGGTNTTCTLGTPALGGGDHEVVFRSPAGYAAQAPAPTLEVPVAVTAIAPNSGSGGGGQRVTVTGSGFGTEAAVTVGPTACDVESRTFGTIVCVTGRSHVDPKQSSYGLANVTVTNPRHHRATLTLTVGDDSGGGAVVSSENLPAARASRGSNLRQYTGTGLYWSITPLAAADSKAFGPSAPPLALAGTEAQLGALAAALNQAGAESLVVVMSHGNWGSYLDNALASALQRCGAPLTLSDYTLAAGTLVVAPRLALIGVCGDATGTNAR